MTLNFSALPSIVSIIDLITCDLMAKKCSFGDSSVYKRQQTFKPKISLTKKKKNDFQTVDIPGILLLLEKIRDYFLSLKSNSIAFFEYLMTCKTSFMTTTAYYIRQLKVFLLNFIDRNGYFIFLSGKPNFG